MKPSLNSSWTHLNRLSCFSFTTKQVHQNLNHSYSPLLIYEPLFIQTRYNNCTLDSSNCLTNAIYSIINHLPLSTYCCFLLRARNSFVHLVTTLHWEAWFSLLSYLVTHKLLQAVILDFIPDHLLKYWIASSQKQTRSLGMRQITFEGKFERFIVVRSATLFLQYCF